jgi:hypothetical protein
VLRPLDVEGVEVAKEGLDEGRRELVEETPAAAAPAMILSSTSVRFITWVTA